MLLNFFFPKLRVVFIFLLAKLWLKVIRGGYITFFQVSHIFYIKVPCYFYHSTNLKYLFKYQGSINDTLMIQLQKLMLAATLTSLQMTQKILANQTQLYRISKVLIMIFFLNSQLINNKIFNIGFFLQNQMYLKS